MKKRNSNTAAAKSHRSFRLKFRAFIFILLLSAGIYGIIDYLGPGKIELKPDLAFGMSCMRAKELIVQEYDKEGNLWATRGMIIYELKKGSEKFVKIAHIPSGPSLFWLRNFSIVRKFTVRPECVEMITTGKGEICALSAGRMWHFSVTGKKFTETLRLDHYGFGDQGLRNDGLLFTQDSAIYLGEYFRNPDHSEVRVFVSRNKGLTWKTAFSFQPGQIRHIHAIQEDPYTNKLWMCTGDLNEESKVFWSENDFKTIIPIGQGNEIWRVCQLVFTEKAVYWGTDTGAKELAGIYRWDRETKELVRLKITDGAMFFATKLAKGTLVMSTDREGMRNEKDDRTRIWIIIPEDQPISMVAGTWNHKKRGIRYKFAMLRFQRDQGSSSLAVTCLNQKEFPDGELLIIDEDTLIAAAKNNAERK
jgi:hypothetical protein